ncbi:hypothetical protein SteCoe_6346 [Stentor coeruleus]|uniref:Uncharacterized protein n=1 Tax=Stentor coeruleus TaxID=5963 RepID=A0A1R2CQ90_9CILI|nr:hypothetical protein SteCoe_6346 [Stentor coeruleus]
MSESKKNLTSRWKNFRKKPDKAAETTNEIWSSEEFTLMYHTLNFSTADVILKNDVFSGLKEKDIIEITPIDSPFKPFVVQVSSDSFTDRANITLSISSQLATSLGLTNLRSIEVKVSRLNSNDYDCEELVISVKNQHLCRSDIWKCGQAYQGLAVYKGQLITKYEYRGVVSGITKDKKSNLTAVVTTNTVITFRSKSCRMTILIEMALEMWEYSPSGILYWEKMITFLTTAFERQVIARVAHDIRVIMYCKATKGAEEVNFYREILRISDLKNTWMDALKAIKREVVFFPTLMNWNINPTSAAKSFKDMFPLENFFDEEYERYLNNKNLQYFQHGSLIFEVPVSISFSNEANLLESINYTLTKYESESINNCTGDAVMIISAGTGLYYTSQKLAKVTKLRVLQKGVPVNIMSMKRHPMHVFPLFIYDKELFQQEIFLNSPQTPELQANPLFRKKRKTKPRWLNIHFFYSFMQLEGTCNLQSAIHLQIHERHKKFHQLFRITDIHSLMDSLNSLNKVLDPEKAKSQKISEIECEKIAGVGLPHIKSSLSDEIKIYPNDKAKTVNAMKFNLRIYDTKIFLQTSKQEKVEDQQSKQLSPKKKNYSSPRPRLNTDLPKRGGLERHMQRESLLSGSSVPHIVRKTFSSLKRRWTECYKVIKELSEEILRDDHKMNDKEVLEYYESVWSDLLEPSLLPLYNDFWPQQKDLGVSQPFYSYINEKIHKEEAINNVIASRLNRGFQIVKKNAVDSFGMKILPPEYAISLGAAYHVITLGNSDDLNLHYMVNTPKVATISCIVPLMLYDLESKGFLNKDFTFSFTYPATWDDEDFKLLGH